MASLGSISDCIRVDSFNWNYEDIILGIFDDATLSLSDNKMIGVAEYSKKGEELDFKEVASLGVSQWGVEGIPGGNTLVTNVRNG